MRRMGCMALVLALGVAAQAEFVPTWRYTPGSTYEQWSFTTPANPTAADVGFFNPYGAPLAVVTPDPAFGGGWFNGAGDLPLGTAQGFWDLGPGIPAGTGAIFLNIPNLASASIKTALVQVVYYLGITALPAISFSPGASLLNVVDTLVESDGMGQWRMNSSFWTITPSPAGEMITISGDPGAGSIVDRVVVDTITEVPEPATLAGLAAGLLLMYRRRRA